MKTDQEIMAHGAEAFDACFGGTLPRPPAAAEGFQAHTLRMMAHFWGGLEPMSLRDKRLVILGVLAGSGADPMMFTIHGRAALANGELTPDELRNVVQMVLPYAGYPKTSPLYMAVEGLLAEHAKPAQG